MTKQFTQDEWEILQDRMVELLKKFNLVACSLLETHTIVLSVSK
jgi:hypothetical protein